MACWSQYRTASLSHREFDQSAHVPLSISHAYRPPQHYAFGTHQVPRTLFDIFSWRWHCDHPISSKFREAV
jgi:hypothetical protein